MRWQEYKFALLCALQVVGIQTKFGSVLRQTDLNTHAGVLGGED
jgi:hypothetical protein